MKYTTLPPAYADIGEGFPAEVPVGYIGVLPQVILPCCYLSPLLSLPDEIANLVLSLESYYKAKAKERQRLSEGRGVKKGVQKSAPVNDDTGRVRDKLAEKA